MPNIMLTYRCNLHCSYCFANEFVNKEKMDITLNDFMRAVCFVTKKTDNEIGLIGGEPTLHPGFQVFMDLLIANPKVKQITLFTNGLLMDHFVSQIINPKVRTLVNVNSPLVIGENAFASIQKNLDMLLKNPEIKDRIKLSINLYSDDMDYTFIMNLLQRYQMHRVRFSLTVPDFSNPTNEQAIDYFKKRKQFLIQFYRNMDSIQVIPYSDCNHPPYCIWTDEERKWIQAFMAKYPDIHSNLLNYSRCIPAIDILPNLQAVRCFGMSGFLKVPITDFMDVEDLTNYFINHIDCLAGRLPACEACKECYGQKTGHCFSGCIGYKAGRIHACNDEIRRQ